MALQIGRRSLLGTTTKISSYNAVANSLSEVTGRRWKSSDAGDVIGIDLGTTNSCVAVMVRYIPSFEYYLVFTFSSCNSSLLFILEKAGRVREYFDVLIF